MNICNIFRAAPTESLGQHPQRNITERTNQRPQLGCGGIQHECTKLVDTKKLVTSLVRGNTNTLLFSVTLHNVRNVGDFHTSIQRAHLKSHLSIIFFKILSMLFYVIIT